jgi:hypothetical protein
MKGEGVEPIPTTAKGKNHGLYLRYCTAWGSNSVLRTCSSLPIPPIISNVHTVYNVQDVKCVVELCGLGFPRLCLKYPMTVTTLSPPCIIYWPQLLNTHTHSSSSQERKSEYSRIESTKSPSLCSFLHRLLYNI